LHGNYNFCFVNITINQSFKMKKTKTLFYIITICVFFSCSKKNIATAEVPSTLAAAGKQAINAAAGNGALGDTNIKYFGRWDFSSTTQYVSYWGGAYLRVNFTGTTVKIKVGTTTNYYAKVDNGPWISYIGASGTINLTPTPLTGGTHTLSVAQGKDYNYVFNFQGLILDAGATTSAPPVATDLIEYIGDSITAGYTDPQANVNDYAWVVSEALGTEHTQIAYPGICLVSGFPGVGMDTQYFKLQSSAYATSPDWDFTKYTPKIVVINLGTNDNNKKVPDATLQDTFTTFLTGIRIKFPNTQIFVMRTFLGVKANPVVAAVNARINAGDTKLHYIDTNGWLTTADYTDGLHPSISGHIKAANLLQPILAPYLTGGTPPVATYLDHCDAAAGWSSANTLTVNTGDKKEGTGALQSTGSNTLEFQKVFTPVNTGATVSNGSVQFWYYVSDVTQLGTSNQVEIGSGGTNDINEYSWNIGPLNNGWNLITKTFSSASVTGGTPNLNAINWFRISCCENVSSLRISTVNSHLAGTILCCKPELMVVMVIFTGDGPFTGCAN
jgi:lysophospholipase L1-like esterase